MRRAWNGRLFEVRIHQDVIEDIPDKRNKYRRNSGAPTSAKENVITDSTITMLEQTLWPVPAIERLIKIKKNRTEFAIASANTANPNNKPDAASEVDVSERYPVTTGFRSKNKSTPETPCAKRRANSILPTSFLSLWTASRLNFLKKPCLHHWVDCHRKRSQRSQKTPN
jgi:hypothetical protein